MTTIISSLSYLCWISVEFYLHFRHISFQFACVKWTFLITAFIVTVHIIHTFQKTNASLFAHVICILKYFCICMRWTPFRSLGKWTYPQQQTAARQNEDKTKFDIFPSVFLRQKRRFICVQNVFCKWNWGWVCKSPSNSLISISE